MTNVQAMEGSVTYSHQQSSLILVVRRPRLDLEGVPRDWYANSPVVTCLVNALHLFIPAGETFFVRTALQASRGLSEPILKRHVQQFAGQESSHSRVHKEIQLMQVKHGQEIDSWLRWYEDLAYRKMESGRSLLLNLSIAVALEHLICSLGAWILEPDHSLGRLADPRMAGVFRWHAAEEIEHKSVLFDVFQSVSGNLLLRWLGLLMAFGEMLSFWISASFHLMRQDPRITVGRLLAATFAIRAFGAVESAEIESSAEMRSILFRLVRALWLYVQPGFHPSQIDNNAAAISWLSNQEVIVLD